MRTGIVGGGITGLTIAYRLAKKGESVSLFERTGELGGLAGGFRLGDVRLEKYFHHIFLSDRSFRGLVREVGLEPELFWRPTPMGVYAEGRIHPFDGPLDLLRFSPLSWIDRVRFGYWILRTGRNPNGLSLDSITVKEWVEKTWKGEIYAKFWRPLLQAKFGDAADEISAAWLWGRIHARANSRSGTEEKLGYLRGGFIRVLEAMAESIRAQGSSVQVGSEVREVRRTSDQRFEVSTGRERFTFDRLVLALPSPLAAQICPELPEEERSAHASIRYQAVACMAVVLRKPLSRIYWLNVGDRSLPFAGVIEHTNLLSTDDYGGNHVVYLFNYLPESHPWFRESKEELFARYEEGLMRMFPDYRRADVVRTMLFHDRFATPIYALNYLKSVPPIVSKLRGLYFANTAHIFPEDRNMNYSVELAEKLLEVMSPGAR